MGGRWTRVLALATVVVVAQATVAWASAGDLDQSFGHGGIAAISSSGNTIVQGVATDSVGRYVAAGSTTDGSKEVALVPRLTADGLTDKTFGTGGTATFSLGGD